MMKTIVLAVILAAFTLAHAGEEAAGEKDSPKLPERVTFMKLISWAENAPKGCDTDLEGSEPPASFTLRYEEEGQKPVLIETSTEDLFGAGWEVINRSLRGYGFEKPGAFTKIDFDIVEELQCSCGKGDDAVMESSLVKIDIDWKAGERPKVTGRLETGGEATSFEPVTMNGRLALYDFRFARAFPGGREGECSSRFFAALGLDQPIE